MTAPVSLSVVLPVYNEESNIEKVVRQAAAFLPKVSSDFEIIAVNDGSRDKSAAVLKALGQDYAFLRVVTFSQNKGYGAALRAGSKDATKDFILLMDSDGQFDISELLKLMPHVRAYDIVAGVREHRSDPFFRILLGRVFNGLVNFIFGLRVADIDCGFKLIRADFLKEVRLFSSGIMIHTEIFLRAKRRQARIKEVAVLHRSRASGRQNTVRVPVIARVLQEAVALWKETRH